MKHVVHSMRYVGLSLTALLGIALGGGAGAAICGALAYLLIAPVAMIVGAIAPTAGVDPMSVCFSAMESCAVMGLAAGGVIATFFVSCRCRAMPESPR